jgi:hypothetical protein
VAFRWSGRFPSVSLLVALSSACGDVRTPGAQFEPDAATGTGSDAGGGAAADAAPPGVDAAVDCSDWRPAVPFDPCALLDRGGVLTLDQPGNYSYDTATDELLDPAGVAIAHAALTVDIEGGTVQLVSTEKLQIIDGAVLVVRGSRPLVLVAWDTFEIAGQIDASSAGPIGPGGNPPDCEDGQIGAPGAPSPDGGSGAGGGGFGGRGGDGGPGGGNTNEGDGGSFIPTPTTLRGGCRGGDAPGRSGSTARGGAGGGALALSAFRAVQLSGVIHAGGAGADGGEGGGGAGGGSGGMLWLDAPQVALADTAILAANGGGGGSGSAKFSEGDDGADGRPDSTEAGGGGGDGGAGDGGSGSSVTPDGRIGAASTSSGGGGGGGGAGVIRIDGELQTTGGAIIVPAAGD